MFGIWLQIQWSNYINFTTDRIPLYRSQIHRFNCANILNSLEFVIEVTTVQSGFIPLGPINHGWWSFANICDGGESKIDVILVATTSLKWPPSEVSCSNNFMRWQSKKAKNSTSAIKGQQSSEIDCLFLIAVASKEEASYNLGFFGLKFQIQESGWDHWAAGLNSVIFWKIWRLKFFHFCHTQEWASQAACWPTSSYTTSATGKGIAKLIWSGARIPFISYACKNVRLPGG